METPGSPLLLVAWRRPHTLRQVIDAIRPIAPMRLFVACDGPNPERPGEAEKVSASREVIEKEIDWPCQIERLYSDMNQGCRLGVSRAITWFFEQVDEGIILEDDCVPHPDFFPYCTTLLERYRNDSRVWCISGNNFQNGQWRGDGSYYFSRYNHCWGWASWRRCWNHYDAELEQWPALRESGLLKTIFENPLERNYWSGIWNSLLDSGMPDSWAYRWTFTCLANGGITALPNRNLVSNVGFGVDASHTTNVADPTVADQGLGVISHPTFLLPDTAADRYSFKHHLGGAAMRSRMRLFARMKARIRNYLHQPHSQGK
jgi:hypothetical protein